MTTTLSQHIDRTIVIGAPPAAVFKYFTDPVRWAAWWGAGSTIDARPGGRVFIKYPGGNEASGEVVDIAPPSRIVFTYGYNSGTPIAPGDSRVTIELDAVAQGTRLRLSHAFADAAVREEHVQGWRYQLSLFANVVTDEVHATAALIWAGSRRLHRPMSASTIATRASTAPATSCPTYPRRSGSCPASACSDPARRSTARASCWPTGRRRAPTARSAHKARTCSRSAPTDGSKR